MAVKLVVMTVGSVRTTGLAEAIEVYQGRAESYFDMEVVEVPRASGGSRGPGEVRRREADLLQERVPDGLRLFGLTREGKGMTSRSLASYLERLGTYGRPGAAFLIGGAHGLDPRILEQCDHRLSLSPMTLPHELARLVLTEQIYRAGTIIRGEPYHKGD